MSDENDTTNQIKAAEERGARWALDACHDAIIRCWAPPISPAGDQRARDAVRICDESRARTRAPADRVSENGTTNQNQNDTIKAAEERGAKWALADRIEAIVFAFHSRDSRRRDVRALAAEVRALPVLRTCGECRWCHPSEVCMHPKAHAEHEIDGCALPPPSWCPHRGSEPDRVSGETLDRPWCAADLPAESVREGRAVSRELALDTALRGLLEVVERYKDRAVPLDAAVRVAKATRAGVADARRQEGWSA